MLNLGLVFTLGVSNIPTAPIFVIPEDGESVVIGDATFIFNDGIGMMTSSQTSGDLILPETPFPYEVAISAFEGRAQLTGSLNIPNMVVLFGIALYIIFMTERNHDG